jgi:tripartite-type tricarboxylate transporter receptor subunit TctC
MDFDNEFDPNFDSGLTRRDILKGSMAVAGAAAVASFPLSDALAAGYPDRNLKVYVPTREGGGADRLLRSITSVWKNYLKVNFEPSFFPGAAGRVGYEKYMGLAKDDMYELLFGNMGPEVLNWVVKKPTYDLNTFQYFAQVDSDPGIIFVSRRSKFKTIDDVIAEGKKRTLNVGVSRLAHPATLGALALGKLTGAKFNPIPLSGGKNTRAGVATGEMDLGALPSGGIVSRKKSFKVLLMFSHKNPLPGRSDNAPTMNDHFKSNMPSLIAGSRAFGIKKSAIAKHPDRFNRLEATLKAVFTDPAFKKAYAKTKSPWEFVGYRDAAQAAEYTKNITKIGAEFRELLAGKRT